MENPAFGAERNQIRLPSGEVTPMRKPSFRWKNRESFVCMAVARVRFKGLSIDEAIRDTLSKGHCSYPELISERELSRIRKIVSKITGRAS